jgi:RNA polymerase sigma factor (sigma-70 family)
MGTATSLDDLVAQALGGSRDALEALVRAVQDDVYGLALRMLWHPQDAADATQEILIKIITHLASFRGESSFRTWCHRVASNHLLTTRASRAERRRVSFEALGEEFAVEGSTREPRAFSSPDHDLLAQEVKLGCTLGILLCLDRPHRLAYIVGEILDLSGDEGADVTDTPPVAYRKRLSRARARMRAFMEVRTMSVSIAPASTACTLIPFFARSPRSACVIENAAAFDAE